MEAVAGSNVSVLTAAVVAAIKAEALLLTATNTFGAAATPLVVLAEVQPAFVTDPKASTMFSVVSFATPGANVVSVITASLGWPTAKKPAISALAFNCWKIRSIHCACVIPLSSITLNTFAGLNNALVTVTLTTPPTPIGVDPDAVSVLT